MNGHELNGGVNGTLARLIRQSRGERRRILLTLSPAERVLLGWGAREEVCAELARERVGLGLAMRRAMWAEMTRETMNDE